MTYSSGSITSARPASAMLAAFDTAITGVAGWSKVSNAIVVGTKTWTVWKSAGASNSFGSDFYVAMGYVTATGTILHMTVFEQWNTVSNLATNFAPNSTQTPTVTTWANPQAAAALPSTGTTIAYIETPALSQSGLTYGITVTPDRLIFWSLSGTNQCGYYLGLYDTFLPLASDPFPLCAVQLGPNGATSANSMTTPPLSLNGLTTREPLQVTAVANNFGCGCNGSSASTWTLNTGSIIELYTNKPMLSRVLLQGRSGNAYRGLLKDCYMGPVQLNAGDQISWTLNLINHTAVRCGAVNTFAIYADQV